MRHFKSIELKQFPREQISLEQDRTFLGVSVKPGTSKVFLAVDVEQGSPMQQLSLEHIASGALVTDPALEPIPNGSYWLGTGASAKDFHVYVKVV